MNHRLLPLKETASHGTIAFPCAGYRSVFTEMKQPMPYNCEHHWHEEFEIIYFEQGTYHLEIGMDRYELKKPCLCFLRSAELHAFYSEENYFVSAVVFSPSMLAFSNNDAGQNTYITPLVENEIFMPRFLYCDHPYFSSVLHHFRDIQQILKPATADYDIAHIPANVSASGQLLIKAALLGIIAILADAGLLTSERVIPDRKIEQIKSSLSYMKEHYAEKIYISDLAKQVSMNEQYFCRFFKKIIGKSPIQYLNELRIQQAMQMLKETDDTIMNISLECGFNNLGNFMRFFKLQAGCTPLQYRKNR